MPKKKSAPKKNEALSPAAKRRRARLSQLLEDNIKKSGKSQREIADDLKIQRATFSRIKNGKICASDEVRAKLAEHLFPDEGTPEAALAKLEPSTELLSRLQRSWTRLQNHGLTESIRQSDFLDAESRPPLAEALIALANHLDESKGQLGRIRREMQLRQTRKEPPRQDFFQTSWEVRNFIIAHNYYFDEIEQAADRLREALAAFWSQQLGAPVPSTPFPPHALSAALESYIVRVGLGTIQTDDETQFDWFEKTPKRCWVHNERKTLEALEALRATYPPEEGYSYPRYEAGPEMFIRLLNRRRGFLAKSLNARSRTLQMGVLYTKMETALDEGAQVGINDAIATIIDRYASRQLARHPDREAIWMRPAKGELAPLITPLMESLYRLLRTYFASCLMMPYDHFREAARSSKYNINDLKNEYKASFSMIAHRLVSLRRPQPSGEPEPDEIAWHFIRVDSAGNHNKVSGGSGFPFPSFGNGCPLWGVYRAFQGDEGDGLITQISAMPRQPGDNSDQITLPDGSPVDAPNEHSSLTRRYLCIARARKIRGVNYAVGIGCEARHADKLHHFRRYRRLQIAQTNGENNKVLKTVIDYQEDQHIGSSCFSCKREKCAARAFPPFRDTGYIDWFPVLREIISSLAPTPAEHCTLSEVLDCVREQQPDAVERLADRRGAWRRYLRGVISTLRDLGELREEPTSDGGVHLYATQKLYAALPRDDAHRN